MMSQIDKSKVTAPRLVKSVNKPKADQIFTCQFEIFGKVQGKCSALKTNYFYNKLQ